MASASRRLLPAAVRFGIANGIPTLAMVKAVWTLLIKRGNTLPEDDRPEPPRGPWQVRGIRNMLDSIYSSLQGVRQGTGKSFLAAIVVCCFLLLGAKVAIAMPSLRQGSRILLRRVLTFMRVLEPCFANQRGLPLRREIKNSLEVTWNNGAALMALSTDDAAIKGAQGYTCRVLVIDESHELKFADLGHYTPLVNVAMTRRRGRLMMIGVGGTPDSCPEVAKTKPEYSCMVIDDVAVATEDDEIRGRLPAGHPRLEEMSWRERFAEERRTTDAETYDQFYRCLPVSGNSRSIFQHMREFVLPLDDPGFRRYYSAGIDLGRDRDRTIIAVTERVGEVENLIAAERLPGGMPYTEQARRIAAWIYERWDVHQLPPGSVFVETNGPGKAVYDIFTDAKHPVLYGVTGVPLTYELKKMLIDEINRELREKRFGVADIEMPGLGAGAREHLAALRVEVKGELGVARYEWEHSDLLSALLMARVGRLSVGGV